MVAKLPIKVVLKQSILKGSRHPEVLQRVATVYINGHEYRVSAPPEAKGDVLEWVSHLTVRQSAGFNSEIEVHDEFGELAVTALKEELEKLKPNAKNVMWLSPRPENAEPVVSDPLSVLKQSIKLVPANKYAFGVLGIVAAAFLSIKLMGGNWFAALVAGVVMLVGMVILRVFASTETRNSKLSHPPALAAQVLTWLCIVVFAIVLSMLVGRLYVLLFPANGIKQSDGGGKPVPPANSGRQCKGDQTVPFKPDTPGVMQMVDGHRVDLGDGGGGTRFEEWRFSWTAPSIVTSVKCSTGHNEHVIAENQNGRVAECIGKINGGNDVMTMHVTWDGPCDQP